ncbi:MAG: FprA family A-type flavoprotein [Bacteroidales bacterium]|jgi:flavorubredoxin|nr:FprA family A-type flavoprotein [Bacteroidales bacterium]
MQTLQIKPDIHWAGILDFDIRNFDIVMETEFGTTYNSYVIKADKIAIVETAKLKFWDTYLENLKSLINPADIAYIVVNHTEPDHSGSLGKLLELAPNACVLGSTNAIAYAENILGRKFNHQIVKDGESVSLGNKTLRFIGAPNLHWPDSIYTYLEEDQILFTCDSFGAHFCHEAMFDDLVGNYDSAFIYYYNAILRPFSKFFLKAIEKIRPLNIQTICPGHGPILRKDWKRYVDMSEKLSKEFLELPQKNRVFVGYVSAYGYTKEAAEKIAEGLKAAGNIEVDLCDLEFTPLSEIAERIEKANAYLFGSPTINQNTLLQIYQCFALMTPLRDKGKLAGTFGSYGWSGEATQIIQANLAALKFTVFDERLTFKFRPLGEVQNLAFEFGKKFGEQFLQQ